MWIRAEMQKVFRTRWLTRPGLAVTHRKEPTPESVSRIRMLQRGIDRARLGLSGDAPGDTSRGFAQSSLSHTSWSFWFE